MNSLLGRLTDGIGRGKDVARKVKAKAISAAQKPRERSLEHGGRTFRYIFTPSSDPDAPLLVVLHGRTKPSRAPNLRAAGWNLLCPIDDHGFQNEGSWFLGEDGDFFWLDAMAAIIDAVYPGDDIWFAGANMGGYGAIVHGLNRGARGVFAHAPQTALLGSAFGQQGLRQNIRSIFGRDRTNRYADLKDLLRPGIDTRFFLTARRGERAEFLSQQILPFVDALIGADIPCEFDLFSGAGNMPPRSWTEIADSLMAVRSGEKSSLFLDQVDKAQPVTDDTGSGPAQRVEDAIRTTIVEPAKMWDKPYPHMTARFEKKLDLYARRAGIPRKRQAIYDHVRGLAERRRENRPPTFFVASPGGSGSHWFQQILSHNAGTVPCGEVYLPEEMMDLMIEVGPRLRGLMIDTMHLLHAYEVDADMSETMLINTAHARGWRIAAHMPDPATTILLQRDPLDVVISRAFRKQKLRRKQFPDLDDRQYLEQNLEYVLRFYEVRDIGRVDAVVRYEELREDIGMALHKLAATGAVPVDIDRIDETKQAFDSGEMGIVNRYRGPKVEIPEALKNYARERLRDLRTHLGYAD